MRTPSFFSARSVAKSAPGALSDRFGRLVNDIADRPVRALRILGLAVVALAVVAGLLGIQAHSYEQLAAARVDAQEQAKHSVVKLLSYNFRTIDQQVADTEGMVTGKFKTEYADLVNKTVAPTAKDKQVAIQTAVVQNAVVSSDNDRMILLMFLDQQSDSKLRGDPILTGSRIRVTLEREADKWLISELAPV